MQKELLILDAGWQFKEFPESARRIRDLNAGSWLDAAVPSSIYTCLERAGVISDAASGSGDIQWGDRKNWIFRKEFDVPPELLEKDRIQIIFHGLDTVTQIWLNEKLIGKTDNMFIAHKFDIKPYLKESRNRLMIKFVSALDHADRLLNRYGKLGIHPSRDPRSVYIRKAAYQFGSEFGTALSGCGIFREVAVEASNVATLENLHLRTIDCNQHYADVRLALELNRIDNSAPLICRVAVTGGGLQLEQELRFGNEDDALATILHIERPFLWWPRGYGVPHLYRVRVDLLTADGQLLESVEQPLGIRTIHIEKTSGRQECVVNGRPVTLQGADWLPLSLLPGVETDYRPLLNRARECHLNLLRVRADGYYENDEFYRLCDEMGILVWQDFMFDSAYYPDRQWFLDSVKEEAASVIKRLQNYACIALWCGNNNIDRLHKSGMLGKGRKFYGRRIYHKLLGDVLCERDPNTPYIPTSSDADAENLVHRTPAIPSPPCRTPLSGKQRIESFADIEKRTHRDGILRDIARRQSDEFHPPENAKAYIRQSQIVQSRRARSAVERFRCVGSFGGCMLGVLNSPALSVNAAMLDNNQQPKALFYYAKRFFAPTLVSLLPEDETGILKAFVVNDTASPITGVLCCRMIAANGTTQDATEMPIRVSPFSRTAPINLPKSLSTPSDPTNAFLSVCIKNNDKTIAENTYFFCPDKQFQWATADIDLHIIPNAEQKAWDVTLTSKVPVGDVQIIPPQPAQISDNFLMLLPNAPKEIRILYQDHPPPIQTPLEIVSTRQALGA